MVKKTPRWSQHIKKCKTSYEVYAKDLDHLDLDILRTILNAIEAFSRRDLECTIWSLLRAVGGIECRKEQYGNKDTSLQ